MRERHYEASGPVHGSVDRVFTHLDDHARLSAHMSRSSWRMGGARIEIAVDAGRGRDDGSHIRLPGRVFGIPLFVEEIVTDRKPPRRKVWKTVGTPRLLVIGSCQMGYELTPRADGSQLRVFIDYMLPEAGLARWLGRLFSGYYARWCTHQMVDDAILHFQSTRA